MIGWSEDFTSFNTAGVGECFGKLDPWSEQANMLFAAGCEAQGFALLSSFAAPLMALWPTEEGGAVVSIYGGRRSGKSVAMAAAGSVWGRPEALDLSIRGAGPSGIAHMADLRHLPVLATKLANIDPVIFTNLMREFLYRKLTGAATVIISVGSQEIGGPNTTEFPIKVPKGLIAPDKRSPSIMEQKLLDNRGTAGVAYLGLLTRPEVLAWARKMLPSRYGLMVDELGLGLEWRFQMRAIASAWVAGDLCVKAGILECSPERIARWAMKEALPSKPAP